MTSTCPAGHGDRRLPRDHLLFAAVDDAGTRLDTETCERRFDVGGMRSRPGALVTVHPGRLRVRRLPIGRTAR